MAAEEAEKLAETEELNTLLTDDENDERVKLKKLVKAGKASAGEVARFEELKSRFRGTKETRDRHAQSFTGFALSVGKSISKMAEELEREERENKLNRELAERLLTHAENKERDRLKKLAKDGKASADELSRLEEAKVRFRAMLDHAKLHRGLEARVKELEEEIASVRRLNADSGQAVQEAVPLPLPPQTAPLAVVVDAPSKP